MRMKKIATTLLFALGISAVCLGQNQGHGEGKIIDDATGKPMNKVQVSVKGPKNIVVTTSSDGLFNLKSLPQGSYTMTINAPGYEAVQVTIVKKASGEIGIPLIRLKSISGDTDKNYLDITVDELGDTDSGHSNEYSPLLTASKDPFLAAAAYTFSPMRFRARGYESGYTPQYLNGMLMNDMITGYSSWYLWSGLNDILRNQDNSVGIQPLENDFGSIGEATNINTRASGQRAQKRLTYSNSNRTYSNRLMFTYASGMMENGWSVAGSVSRRWGNGIYSYVRGQFYDSWGYYLGIEKMLNPRHRLSLTFIGSPTKRGVGSASTQEAYDLVGSNFYNPNIGKQDDKWRNSRVKDYHEPMIQLSHIWKPGDNTNLTTSVGYRFGKNAYSALTWMNAPDPRPDYYRNLPSYFTARAVDPSFIPDEASAEYAENLWKSDRNTRYINWDKLYEINKNNNKKTYDSNGILLAEGLRSEYAIEDRMNDQQQFNFATVLNTNVANNFKLDAGLNMRLNRTHNYNKMNDLLGGEYWYDIDKFAERDFSGDPAKVQLNLLDPDRIVKKGDKMGHDYYAYIRDYNAWAVGKYKYDNLDAYAGVSLGVTSMMRKGLQQRGLFPTNSYGESDTKKFFNYGFKLGGVYSVTGNHFLEANMALMQQAPYFRNIFISPRTRNSYVTDPKPEKIYSGDLSYNIRLPWLRGRITGFYTRINDQTRGMSFYDDSQGSFSNLSITGIDTEYAGLEVGMEAKLSPTLTATGAFTYGRYRYASDADFIQTVDNSAKVIMQDKVYWNGLNTSGTPQTAGTIGLTYRAPWYGMFGINANYFDRNFISMNPIIRTERARTDLENKYAIPEKLKGGFTLDVFAGYSYRINYTTYLRFNISVSNVLNNKKMQSGGYEQLRVMVNNDKIIRPFDSKLFYMYGTTFFFNTSLQF